MYYLPWWLLLACLVASALVAYLFLRRTQAGDSPWALFPLTTALAPVVLLGAIVVAITLSTLLSALVEDRAGIPKDASEPPAREERMSNHTTSLDRTHPATATEQTITSTATVTPAPTSTPTAASTSTATATASP